MTRVALTSEQPNNRLDSRVEDRLRVIDHHQPYSDGLLASRAMSGTVVGEGVVKSGPTAALSCEGNP